jgi:hypothetical protein
LPEELARVGGEGFHVAALSFGENRIECQGRLARAGQAGQDDQFIPRDFDSNVLKVVFARANHAQVF